MSQPDRVLLLRTGRHLQVAMTALRARWPQCEIAVVGTPGSEAAIAQAGVAPACTLIYDRTPTFRPVAFRLSRTAWAARQWGFDQVAVLWNDPSGTGQGNVDRTAFALAPEGFVAVTPDGRLIDRRLWPQVRRELRRAATSLVAGCILGALFVPGWIVSRRRRP
jgi:hypothetical protein